MGSERMTIPLNEDDAKLLQDEAENQGRTFSGYIQRVLHNHIEESEKICTTETPKKKKKVRIIKRKRG